MEKDYEKKYLELVDKYCVLSEKYTDLVDKYIDSKEMVKVVHTGSSRPFSFDDMKALQEEALGQ